MLPPRRVHPNTDPNRLCRRDFLFVPLGDLMERRRLIITMLLATALALGGAAVSPNITWLVGASLVIGMTTIAAQLIVPFAAQLAKPKSEARLLAW